MMLEEMVNQYNNLEMLTTLFWPKHNIYLKIQKNFTSNRI